MKFSHFYRRSNSKNYQNSDLLLKILQYYWIFLIIYGELLSFYFSISKASWPTDRAWKIKDKDVSVSHISIIANPKLVDFYSYSHTGPRLMLEQIFTDTYMAKSYYFLNSLKSPSRHVILGNLMDGGRDWTDVEWELEWKRFQKVFKVPKNQQKNKVKLHFLAGNHDIGVGKNIVPWAVQRFRNQIGPLNYAIEVGNHLLVVLDTISFESEDKMLQHESHSFLEYIKNKFPSKSKILFSHIPLFRQPGTNCGPFRQKGTKSIEYHTGNQYKTLLGESTSSKILQALKPDLVFSGEDPDNCLVEHNINGRMAQEVGAFGWANGVKRPSIGLLSLYSKKNDGTGTGLLTDAKFEAFHLPYQLGTYIMYGISFAVSLLLVILDYMVSPKTRHDSLPLTNDQNSHQKPKMQYSGFAGFLYYVFVTVTHSKLFKVAFQSLYDIYSSLAFVAFYPAFTFFLILTLFFCI